MRRSLDRLAAHSWSLPRRIAQEILVNLPEGLRLAPLGAALSAALEAAGFAFEWSGASHAAGVAPGPTEAPWVVRWSRRYETGEEARPNRRSCDEPSSPFAALVTTRRAARSHARSHARLLARSHARLLAFRTMEAPDRLSATSSAEPFVCQVWDGASFVRDLRRHGVAEFQRLLQTALARDARSLGMAGEGVRQWVAVAGAGPAVSANLRSKDPGERVTSDVLTRCSVGLQVDCGVRFLRVRVRMSAWTATSPRALGVEMRRGRGGWGGTETGTVVVLGLPFPGFAT